MESLNEEDCRLCGGRLLNRFSLKILYKYHIAYYECEDCRSLQTEQPYWLAEAYKQNLSNIDTGAAQRTLHNLAACYLVSWIFNVKNSLDIGGGDGLLCRLLRDYGVNCFVKDKYATSTYAQGFNEPDFQYPDLITAFEVLEHFKNPVADLDELFHLNPKVLLLTTAIYANNKEDWWYLAPESGQHIFFYSEKSLNLIAKKYDYKIVMRGGYVLFVKKYAFKSVRLILANLLLSGRVCRFVKALVMLLPTPGIWQDQARMKKNGEFKST